MKDYSELFALRRFGRTLTLVLLLWSGGLAHADSPAPYPRTVTARSAFGFGETVSRLEQSVEKNKMGLVAKASASAGAAGRGVKIAGNAVLMVFRNDYAVRMLAASVSAGIEAPLRLYVTENVDGKANVTYRAPSAVFVPYGNAQLDAMARELDPVFDKIVREALAR